MWRQRQNADILQEGLNDICIRVPASLTHNDAFVVYSLRDDQLTIQSGQQVEVVELGKCN